MKQKRLVRSLIALGLMVVLAVGLLAAGAFAGAQNTPVVLSNTAPGTKLTQNSAKTVSIDTSNASSGYVMVSANIAGSPNLVVRITCPDTTVYTYFKTASNGTWQAFPLTQGKGTYQIGVYQNTTGTKYLTLLSAAADTGTAMDANAPFLRPNFFVNYNAETSCVKEAATICANCSTELEKVTAVYNYVVKNFTYDYTKASTVSTGYCPDLQAVWTAKKGICFDYAATMCAMLRSQSVPAKLVVGYAGTTYHAWISVYTKQTGWVESLIYFDGVSWKYMDPTYASTGGAGANSYITNSANYAAKFVY